jgi:MFS family permease
MKITERLKDKWFWVVLITGLGFFSDGFDSFSYGVIRVPSLTELGLSGDTLTKTSLYILNYQVFGSLVGGILWGLLGDKIGRKKALLGSIVIDSVAMIANAFVHTVPLYTVARFFIGFGFAGEVGLGATLVAEILPKTKRTYALAMFTVFGLLGVATAALSIEWMNWRMLTFVGGAAGLLLLGLRGWLLESGLFNKLPQTAGFLTPLKKIFSSRVLAGRYVACVLILTPNFFVTGFLLILSPELAKYLHLTGAIKPSTMMAVYFAIAVVGDFFGAFLTERMKSRRKAVMVFLTGTLVITLLYLYGPLTQALHLYILAALLGLFNLWALSSTVSVEQFPTELRATVSTSVVNFARCMQIPMNMAFLMLKPFGLTLAAGTVGVIFIALALLSAFLMRETYHADLEKIEL